jgi:hypothetical protein
MLSVEQCRTVLDIPELSDDEVAKIRDTLYGFAHTLIEEYLRERKTASGGCGKKR